jgi:hypothetical protein
MSHDVRIPELDRITFFSGQQLTAGDLTALETANRELRWLHNRSLHAWGIGIGFDVNGRRGDSLVSIDPGYGIDGLGREIILTERRFKTVPAVSAAPGGADATYYLVAAYQLDADQQVAERQPGVCLPAGTVRLTEEPLLDWKGAGDLREGQELILAKASVRNCRLSSPLSLAERRSARSISQPYIAAGQTTVGNTEWQSWKDQLTGQIGVFTDVDTSSGGFSTTPAYFAHVVGSRFIRTSPGMLAGFTAIVNATVSGFTIQVLLPNFSQNNQVNPSLNDPKTTLNELNWHVVWMGIAK